MIHAGTSDLRRAFKEHRRPTIQGSRSDSLLNFYAAECGLKLAYLQRRKLRNTNAIDPVLRESGHDLIAWAKELRLPAALMGIPHSIALRRDGKNIAVGSAHEAWRYGVEIDTHDETRLSAWLTKVCEWASHEELR